MTDATEKVELRPETLLAHGIHIAAAEALRGDQPFLRWDGCAERNAQLGRARSSRNSVPSVRPQTQALEPLQGDRLLRRRGTPAAGSYAFPPGSLPPGRGHFTYSARREA